MTSEEFIAACQERCLAGRCGWPLCSSAPRGAERDSERPRGKYRVALAERKVYLRGDLDMFCGDAHRKEAETLGCSLALNLEEGTSNTGASSEGAKKDARSREEADATRSGLEGFGGVGASEKKKPGPGKKGRRRRRRTRTTRSASRNRSWSSASRRGGRRTRRRRPPGASTVGESRTPSRVSGRKSFFPSGRRRFRRRRSLHGTPSRVRSRRNVL